ncbi:hypothetical protein IMAU30132_01029 [Lactobacillus helveticus]|nr:plasmid mobilization relaxosome protein MobC [Lactobacillus helveticus]NRO04822.1 hypothetical protein [Lactobacillus helveticus]NRO39061.1 hypothetical protein [Lactobacillus helveticus]NRO48668.1 hypothetical protein [Lactobacillus helveticus]NRO59125.1 hypothetical protein [Lactobacillus helveticus]
MLSDVNDVINYQGEDFSEYKNIISEISSTKSELKRIGNNINQIAKHLNENKNNQTKELMIQTIIIQKSTKNSHCCFT